MINKAIDWLADVLLAILDRLVPLERILDRAVLRAAQTRVAREVAEEVREVQAAFVSEMAQARARAASKLATQRRAPSMITPEGARALVTAAVVSASDVPQGKVS